MPITKISFAWHFGFYGSGIVGLLAIALVFVHKEYGWIWMPAVGIGLSISFAVLTRHLMAIW
jgi:hypothetical protein